MFAKEAWEAEAAAKLQDEIRQKQRDDEADDARRALAHELTKMAMDEAKPAMAADQVEEAPRLPNALSGCLPRIPPWDFRLAWLAS